MANKQKKKLSLNNKLRKLLPLRKLSHQRRQHPLLPRRLRWRLLRRPR
jgi:hypothetical protein